MTRAAEPIVFVSRHRPKEGRVDALRTFLRAGARALEAAKPRTSVFAAYLDDPATTLTIVHVFASAEAFDAHVEGADTRSASASELLDPVAIEIYGRPSDAALDLLRRTSGGAPITVAPEFAGGFLRTPVVDGPDG